MVFLFTILITNIAVIALILFFIRKLIKNSKGRSNNIFDTAKSSQQPVTQNTTATQLNFPPSVNESPVQKQPKSALDMPSDTGRTAAEIRPVSQEEIMGMDFYHDVYSLPDGPEKTSYMMAFAQAGDSGAQYLLGNAYIFGKGGLKPNFQKAKVLLEKSADQGNTNAMADLALLCMEFVGDVFEEAERNGDTSEVYMPKAMKLVDQSAFNLAKALMDYNKTAVNVYNGNMKMAWNQGSMRELLLEKTNKALQPLIDELKVTDDGTSNYILGLLTTQGIGIPQDIGQAKQYFGRGASLGHFQAKLELGNPLFAFDDDDE